MKASLLALLVCIVQSSGAAPLPTKELIAIAGRHSVPMPPAGTRLVLAHTLSWSVLGNRSTSRDPGIYSPAFLLEENTNGIVILRGMERHTVERIHPGEPLWRPFSVEPVVPKIGGHAVSFANTSAFVTVVQLAVRGDDTNCQALWKRVAEAEWLEADGFGDSFKKDREDPALLLASGIFIHLRRELLQDQPPWPDIQSRMNALFAEFPGLKTNERAALLDDLGMTVSAKPPAVDSTEALVLQLARIANQSRSYGTFDKDPANKAGALSRVILLRGRDAVPDLIALLGDRRLTAGAWPAFANAPARIRRVGDLAEALLRELTGLPGSPDAAAFRDWLARNKQKGEEETLVSSLFERQAGKIKSINEVAARAIAQKYPGKLSGLCEVFSKDAGPEGQPFGLAEAIADAQLPMETRVKILAEFAQRGPLAHRRCVLQVLARLDARNCAELLLPILKKLPADVPGPYWTCPEAALTHVVVQIEEDDLWREYLRTARRSSVGLRMEMMNPMCYTYIGSRNHERRLAFLAALLDDPALRDNSISPKKFDGPCAAFTIPKITVRDFAAEKIASMVGLTEHPDEFWTPAQWEELHKKVRAKIDDLKLPDLEPRN